MNTTHNKHHKTSGSGGRVVVLNTTSGVCNLPDLSNGRSTAIATGDLDAGTGAGPTLA